MNSLIKGTHYDVEIHNKCDLEFKYPFVQTNKWSWKKYKNNTHLSALVRVSAGNINSLAEVSKHVKTTK